MAVAAFRSTTKRSCIIGNSQESGATPSHRGHRRTRSFSDFNSQCFSDSTSEAGDAASHADLIFHKPRSSSRFLTSDSESEAEPGSRFNRGRRSADLKGIRRDLAKANKDPHGLLRRSASQKDLSDNSMDVFYSRGRRSLQTPGSGDHPEEEKTIRAVHSVSKEPLARELDAVSLYDAMRMEMRRAVADIRSELEQSLGRDGVFCGSTTVLGVPKESLDGRDSKVADLRLEYSVKLEESQKRAQELWTKLTIEERRCLDLVKLVKELEPSAASLFPQSISKSSDNGADYMKKDISSSLDEDARRYFEECVSISVLDPFGLENQEASLGQTSEELSYSPRSSDSPQDSVLSEQKNALLKPLIAFCECQVENSRDRAAKHFGRPSREVVNGDGLVLPWLHWETDIDPAGCKGENEHTKFAVSSSLPSAASLGRSSSQWNVDFRSQKAEQLQRPPIGISGLGLVSDKNAKLSCWKKIDRSSRSSVDNIEEVHFNVDKFLLERRTITQGVLVCGGKMM